MSSTTDNSNKPALIQYFFVVNVIYINTTTMTNVDIKVINENGDYCVSSYKAIIIITINLINELIYANKY